MTAPVFSAVKAHVQQLQRWENEGWSRSALLVLTTCVILAEILQLRVKWKYRNIPGPMGLPVIGNLPSINRLGLHIYIEQCKNLYGNTFKIWMGRRMTMVTTDPEIARVYNSKLINRGALPYVLADEHGVSTSGLFQSRGDRWRNLRLAWQPAFRSSNLEEYASLMSSSAVRLTEQLRDVADNNITVDIWRELGKMTLDVVGTSAYGVNLHTLDNSSEMDKEARQLINALRTVIENFMIFSKSIYQFLLMILPPLWEPLVRIVSWYLPDRRLKKARQASQTLKNASLRLIKKWRSSHAPIDNMMAEVNMKGRHADISATSQASRQLSQGKGCPIARNPAPGNFLDLMCEAKNDMTDQAFSDDIVTAQLNNFFVAGYETTANALAFAIYCLSTNKEAQTRMLNEVDAFFVRGRAVINAEDIDEKVIVMKPHLEVTLRKPRDDIPILVKESASFGPRMAMMSYINSVAL